MNFNNNINSNNNFNQEPFVSEIRIKELIPLFGKCIPNKDVYNLHIWNDFVGEIYNYWIDNLSLFQSRLDFWWIIFISMLELDGGEYDDYDKLKNMVILSDAFKCVNDKTQAIWRVKKKLSVLFCVTCHLQNEKQAQKKSLCNVKCLTCVLIIQKS